jgi:hypothetical protein
MQKIVNKLITSSIKSVDVYRWKNATWLIFTDETRWVVELTDEGTLWYNYKFFKDIFKYVSITVGTEMDGYIIQWANEYFFKVSTLRSIANNPEKDRSYTEKVLNYGIKETGDEFERHTRAVIDNGVKEILNSMTLEPKPEFVEDVINQGIKEVYDSSSTHRQMRAQNLMGRIIRDVKPNIEYSEQTGVYDPDCNGNKTEIWRIIEEVKPNLVDVLFEEQIRCYHDPTCNANNTMITDIIEGGVKQVKPNVVFHGIDKSSMSFVPCNGNTTDISSIVKSGIKNIYPDQMSGDQGYNWSNEFEADKVIQGGVKL